MTMDFDEQLRKIEQEQVAPEDKAVYDLASRLYVEGRIDEAVTLFERFIAVVPYWCSIIESSAREYLADCYVKRGEFARALQQLNFAIDCCDSPLEKEIRAATIRERDALLREHP